MRSSTAFVGWVCFLLACLSTTVNTLAVLPTPQNRSNILATTPLVNTTSLDTNGDLDPRFGFLATYGETDIPHTACLMNVVELLYQYAKRDWLGQVGRRHGIVLPEYPQVEIAVLPAAPAITVEVRLVVWGLWFGIWDIVRGNKFHEVEFEVLWENEIVAYIYLTLPMDRQVISGNGTLGTDDSLALLSNPNEAASDILDTSHSTENSSDGLDEEDFTWKPTFPPYSRPLTVVDVFITVIASLKSAAPHPASEKVQGPFSSAAIDVQANMQFYLFKRRNPRTRPPFFQYIHVFKALRAIPGYMLQKKRFSELFFQIEVSGLVVGDGYLQKGHYVPPAFVLGNVLESKGNVSLS